MEPLQDPRDKPVSTPTIQVLTAQVKDLRFWNWDQHGLPYWRLYWNDQLGGHILGPPPVELDPAQLVLIAPQTPTRLRLRNPVQHLFIHFLASPPFHNPARGAHILPLRRSSHLRPLVADLFAALSSGTRSPVLSLQVLQLISHVLATLPPTTWNRPPIDQRVHEALLHIERQLAGPLTVDTLAERANLSEAAFARLFKADMQISPYQYILRRRVEEAARQLSSSSLSIPQIAERCGFCDRYHFTRAFTQAMRRSPGVFRATHTFRSS